MINLEKSTMKYKFYILQVRDVEDLHKLLYASIFFPGRKLSTGSVIQRTIIEVELC